MPHGLTTAPVNPAPRWPAGYIEALREVGAQEKAIPLMEVYYERFRGIALAPRPDAVATPTAGNHPAPVRETTRSRPMDHESTTVQHPGPSKSMHDARSYAPGRRPVKPDLKTA